MAVVAAGCGSSSPSSSRPTRRRWDHRGLRADRRSRVGLVTDIGGLNDRGFNQLAYNGLKQAESELGAKGRVKQSNTDSDYVPNLQHAGAQGNDLIIAVGFLMENAVGQVSKFPNAKFAIIDVGGRRSASPERRGLLFKEQESGYLVGYLAGLVTQERQERRLVRRRPEDPAGRPLHRRLPGGRQGGRTRG